LYVILACCLLGVAIGYGIYGISIGGFKNFDWFSKNGKITINCAIIITLL